MTERAWVHRSGRLSVGLLALCLQGMAGCSSDASSTTALAPAGPPGLSVESPLEGACVPLLDGDPVTARVRIAVTNWSLRPPGVCGVYPQCGYAAMFVDGQRLIDTASLVTDVPFGKLSEPSGSHTLRVELHDDTDEVALDADGEPLRVDRALVTAAVGSACP